MKPSTLSRLVVLVLLGLIHTRLHAAPEHDSFLGDSRWDQGTAEFSTYTAQERRYGTLREARVSHILVKEPWNDALGVKSDGKGDGEVLKLNQITSVPTGMYRYEQMHSLFLDRQSGALKKFSYSHHDACGNTFKMGLARAGKLFLTWHTYWDGEGDGQRTLEWPSNTHLYEELPVLVRRWAAAKPAFPYGLRLLNPQMFSRLGTPGSAAARAEVATREGQHRFTINHPGGKDLLVVDEAFPHILRSWTRADGSQLTLVQTRMIAYWEKNQPGDETLLNPPSSR
jgi:hypothetical protein